MLQFDEDGARHILRLYSTPDVVQQRARVLALLDAQPGERVLYIGLGPGFLVASLADVVGAGGAVHGLDQSAPMNAVARDLIATRPWAGIDDGDALELPYGDGAFDARGVDPGLRVRSRHPAGPVGTASRAAARWTRSRPRHRLGLSGVARRRSSAASPRHGRLGGAPRSTLTCPARCRGSCGRAGFRVTGRHLIPLFNSSFEPNTFSALNMEMIARFVSGRQGLTDEEVDAWMADLRERGAEDDYLFSLNRYCFLAVAE